jgi:hypothetical protein
LPGGLLRSLICPNLSLHLLERRMRRCLLEHPVLISGGQVLYLPTFVLPKLHHSRPGLLHGGLRWLTTRLHTGRWTLGIGKPKGKRHAVIQSRQD